MTNTFLMFEDAAPAGNNTSFLIIIGVFLVAMIFFTVIPQKKKQKQMQQMSSRIKVGDKIKTIGGIFGTIVGYDEDNNVYTVLSGNSTFEVDKNCVYSMEMLGIKTEEIKPVEETEAVETPAPVTESEKTEEVEVSNEEKPLDH